MTALVDILHRLGDAEERLTALTAEFRLHLADPMAHQPQLDFDNQPEKAGEKHARLSGKGERPTVPVTVQKSQLPVNDTYHETEVPMRRNPTPLRHLGRTIRDIERGQLESQKRLLEASKAMLERYVALVNCGDCGNWNPETEKEVIALRAAIADAELDR